MTNRYVKPLFDLPESSHKVGFVEVLSQAVERPQQTASTYVVTALIRDASENALELANPACLPPGCGLRRAARSATA